MFKKTSNRILLAMLVVMFISVAAQIIHLKMTVKEVTADEVIESLISASPTVESFEGLSINGSFIVNYTEGAPALEIKAPDVQRKHISVWQEDSVLIIRNKSPLPDDKRIVLNISGGPLASLSLRKNSILESELLPQSDFFVIKLRDHAKLNLKLVAKAIHFSSKNNTTANLYSDSTPNHTYMFIEMKHNSKLDAAAVKVETIRTVLRDSSSASIWPSGYLGSNMWDNSTAQHKGNPTVFHAHKSSNELQKIDLQPQSIEE